MRGANTFTIRFLSVGMLAALALGCGSGGDQLPRAQVTGKVTLNGEPVSAATILFRPAAGRAGRGKVENGVIVETSTYGINDGIVLGTHKIALQPVPDVAPVTTSRLEDSGTSGGSQPLPSYAADLRKPKAKPADIPAKYQDPDLSGLTAEVSEDGSELTLELTR
jgi:hypothetical protein